MFRKSTGFTAIELAMTLAIMAILATFFMPPYLHWLRTSRLRGAVNNLMGDIEMAKIRAIRENSFVAIQFQDTGYNILVDNGAGTGIAGDWTINGDEEFIREREMPAGVTIDTAAMTLDSQRVRFNGRGLPPDVIAAEIISLQNQSASKNIRLNRLGNLELD